MSRAQGEKRSSVLRRAQMSEARPAGTLPGPPATSAPMTLARVVEVDLSGEVPLHRLELVEAGTVAARGVMHAEGLVPAADGSELAVDDPAGDRSLVLLVRMGMDLVAVPLGAGGGIGAGSEDNVIYSVNRAPLFQA